jgi:hypothetical protein
MRELYRKVVLWTLRKVIKVLPKGKLRTKVELWSIHWAFKRRK